MTGHEIVSAAFAADEAWYDGLRNAYFHRPSSVMARVEEANAAAAAQLATLNRQTAAGEAVAAIAFAAFVAVTIFGTFLLFP